VAMSYPLVDVLSRFCIISSWVVFVIISLRLGSCWMLYMICWTVAVSWVLSLNMVSVGCRWLSWICYVLRTAFQYDGETADVIVSALMFGCIWLHIVGHWVQSNHNTIDSS